MSFKRGRDHASVIAFFRPPALVLLFTAALISCGPDALTGRAVLSGSSTLAPLASTAVEAWHTLHPKVETRVEVIGSDAGLERLVRYGDADFALVSRPLTEADQAEARAAGKELLVLPLAWDAVAIVVSASNTWAASLSRAQAVHVFTTASLWSDLDPAWPGRPIHRFALGPNSGTADVFASALLGGRKSELFTAPEVQASEDDAILSRGVAQVDGALGYLGWTTNREADRGLRIVALDGVKPSQESIRGRTYGLPRQLWLVTTRQGLAASEAARSMIRYLYEHSAALASQAGLIPLAESERAAVGLSLDEATHP
jgi:phosphate transport system substrate-binding protein